MDKNRPHTTEACWKDLSSQLPRNGPGVLQYREAVANATRVSLRTVLSWMDNPNSMKGMALIRLRYFLEDQGYRVLELEKLRRELRDLGRYIYENRFTFEFAKSELRYINDSDLYRRLHGWGKKLSADRMALLRQLLAKYSSNNGQNTMASNPARVVPLPEPESLGRRLKQPSVITTALHVEVFANLANAMHPLASLLTSVGTPEDRKMLRTLIGEQKYFELATMMNQLCGEDAFEQYSRANKRAAEQS